MVIRSLELNGRDQNSNAVKKSYGNVNPAASNLVLKNFAVGLNNLTNNTLLSIVKVDREDITSVAE